MRGPIRSSSFSVRSVAAKAAFIWTSHAELYKVRDGKVVYRKGFTDPDEAFEAAGLEE